jgi:formate dehydrogenase subunit beta
MNNQWFLETHGDPLGKVRGIVRDLWLQADLAGMLVTMDTNGGLKAIPRFITDPAFVNEINPFRPLMEMNIARIITEIISIHPGEWIATVLRPCEMRALIEMIKHAGFNTDSLLTISVDCLGTLPADEYQWRIERLEKSHPAEEINPVTSEDDLAGEALKFARQGGIVPYRYRTACQVCASPAADQADININVLGLPVRQRILVSITNPKFAQIYNLEKLVDGLADEQLIAQHEHIVARMSERHERTMERVKQGLGNLLPENVEALISQLENCGECQSCLDVCPICSVDRPYRGTDGHYDQRAVMRWLVSCAGCGMCEQACPDRLPIASIFGHIRQQLDQEWQYFPGRSKSDLFPAI